MTQGARRSRLAAHPEVLDLIVQGAPLDTVLRTVVELVEAELPGARVAILTFDLDRLHLVPVSAPSFPAPFFLATQRMPIGPGIASCGTAAYEDRDVITARIDDDPAWTAYLSEARALGLVACWSTPFHGAQHEVLGTVAAYFGFSRSPADGELDVLHDAGSLAAMAIQHDTVRRSLRSTSRTHPVTGIANRLALVERLRAVEAQAAETDERFAVVMASVDGMSPINESLGVSAGDAVLRGVAERLTSLVGDAGTVAHVWGCDFVVLVEGLGADAAERARDLGERVRAVVAEPFAVDGMTLAVDVSVGVSASGHEVLRAARPEDEPLRTANVALEHARQSGGDEIGVYDPAADPRGDVRLLAPELRRGLEEEQLTLAYQPIVDLADDHVVRYEALLRWHGPRGTVSPGSFVPVAEQTGLVGDLGRYALERALAALARRTADGGAPVGLSVNLSARQLLDETLPDTVGDLLTAHRVSPELLTLEVTEGVLLRSDSKGWKTLDRMAELGVRVALDDFGAGFAQVSYLRRFGFDEIKIDQELVRSMADDTVARAIVVGVIAFAREAGIPFVAEGVERREQADELRDLGASYGQGFLFGAPQREL